jgi:catechol 2,3-dioxygenase-like lactoylglutathione lyase family enzyme
MNTNTFPRMHISYYVSNLTNTVNFYNTFFGKQADKVKAGYAKYVLEKPSLVISFIEHPDKVQNQFGHLGFQVESQEEMNNRLAVAKEQGIVSKEEMGTNCCYATQDKFWVSDPDGYQWEVYYFHNDVEVGSPHYEQQQKADEACCSPKAKNEQQTELVDLTKTAEPCCVPGTGCC